MTTNQPIRRLFSKAAMALLLLLMTTATAWANPTGSIDYVYSHNGSISFGGWAYEESTPSTPIPVQVQIWSVNGETHIKTVEFMANNPREDLSYNCGFTGVIPLDEGTYKVKIMAVGTTSVYLVCPGVGPDLYPQVGTPWYISYDANGGTGAPAPQTNHWAVPSTLSTVQPTRTGYTFTGWNTKADGTGVPYPSGYTDIFYVWQEDRTLYAQWTPTTIGSIDYVYSHNGSISFGGWAYEKTNPSTPIPVQVQIWSVNGETHIKTVEFMANNPREDLGYNCGFTGVIPLDEGPYKVKIMAVGSTSVYLVWTGVGSDIYPTVGTPWYISYDANGGTGAPAPQTNHWAVSSTLSTVQPTRTGYTFTGWNTKADGTGVPYPSGYTDIFYVWQEDRTLYAQWKPVTYIVRFHKNDGGEDVSTNQEFTYDASQALTTNAFTRDGYEFIGWAESANGAVTKTDGQSVSNLATVQDDVVNLYAKWKPVTYIVRFHKNDGGEDVYTDQEFTYDASQALTTNAFTRDGYEFIGWAESANGAVTKTDGQSVTNLATVQDDVVNLYSKWSPKSYSITYDLAGGSVATANPATYTVVSDDITLVNPTRKDYTFAGWTGTGLTEPTMNVTITTGSTINRSYTATWTYTPVYNAYNPAIGTFEERVALSPTIVTNTTTTMGAANTETWYAVKANVNVSSRIEAAGTVNLILCDGMKLTASQGIHVKSGTTLNIYAQDNGTGTLSATWSGNDKAGIGGNNNENGGTVTIHGGNVTARSGGYAAGIGGGVNASGGACSIYGGSVTASSGNNGAGIGGGRYGSGGTITITGGTVIASAVSPAQALGHGAWGGANANLILVDMIIYASANTTTPVALADRESTCRSAYVKLMPCTKHNFVDNVCTYCNYHYYCHLIYDANGATAGTVPVDATDYVNGESTQATILDNIGNLERTGYSFAGWNTQADGLGTNYAPNETFTISSPFTLYAQWIENVLELANSTSNDEIISEAVESGMTYNRVILTDRTLFKDGYWNTLCLPFNIDEFADTPLEGATVKTLVNTDFSGGTLTMNFSNSLTSTEAGKPYIVKWGQPADFVIMSADDWNTLAANTSNYTGKVVKLGADISVTTMMGGLENVTFDGCGHTLNVALSGTGYCVAPFPSIKNCTIKNLIVTGSVTGGMHCSGLIGSCVLEANTDLIENCDVRAAVSTNQTHCGGFIGHSQGGTVTIRNCKFSGSISGATNKAGIFNGWSGSISLTNCLAAGTYSIKGNLEMSVNTTYNNSYKTQSVGSGGTYTTSTGETLRSALGNGWKMNGNNVIPKTVNSVNNIVNPVFSSIIINDACADISTDYVDFIGTSSPVALTPGDKSVLFLGDANTLYYPNAANYDNGTPDDDTDDYYRINANRAYFQLKNGLIVGDPTSGARVLAINLNFDDGEQTGILTMSDARSKIPDVWYTLDGKKLSGKPTKRGIYVTGGKKVVM